LFKELNGPGMVVKKMIMKIELFQDEDTFFVYIFIEGHEQRPGEDLF
jgi:hypothetical protein